MLTMLGVFPDDECVKEPAGEPRGNSPAPNLPRDPGGRQDVGIPPGHCCNPRALHLLTRFVWCSAKRPASSMGITGSKEDKRWANLELTQSRPAKLSDGTVMGERKPFLTDFDQHEVDKM